MKEQHKQQKQLTLSDIEKELSCNEDSSTQNLAGYDSEIQVTLDLLNILGNSHFSGHEELRKFLLEGQGDQLSYLDTTDTEFLRCLQTSVYETLETLERSIHFVEEKQFLDQSKRLAILNRGQLERYKAKLLSWFAIPLPSGDLSKNEKFVYNRMSARGKGATSLFSLLKLRDNIERLKEIYSTINKNVQEGSTNPEDYWIFIATILALPDEFKEEGMVAKAVELSRNHFDNIDKLKNSGQKLESCFYLTLLNWPSSKNYMPNLCPLSVLKKAITLWSDVSSSLPADKRRRDKILFYLGNGNDNNLFIYDECLKKNPSPRSSKPNIYRTNFALNQLARLEGLLKNNGEVVEVKLCKPGDKVGSTIQIPVLCPIKRHTAWNRNVYFILGFGLKGLKAIDLTEELPSSVYEKDSAEQERVKGYEIRNSPYPTMQDICKQDKKIYQSVVCAFYLVLSHIMICSQKRRKEFLTSKEILPLNLIILSFNEKTNVLNPHRRISLLFYFYVFELDLYLHDIGIISNDEPDILIAFVIHNNDLFIIKEGKKKKKKKKKKEQMTRTSFLKNKHLGSVLSMCQQTIYGIVILNIILNCLFI
ncbi:hypothetical protein KUTeg_009464 [Tegillarca granosa]|uniref:Uncharacterized protein n=1 Tax=Tegillarca granosa TaxID=220873 RepID=A0ABQ9F683_TEGGR|nr:hypothetical protein KUTeg_009464 [Tegillarca granosa]